MEVAKLSFVDGPIDNLLLHNQAKTQDDAPKTFDSSQPWKSCNVEVQSLKNWDLSRLYPQKLPLLSAWHIFNEFDRFNGPPPLRPLAKPPSRITNFQNSPLLTSQDANVRAYLIYENFVLLTTVLYHIFPLFTAINPTSHWLGFLLGIPRRSLIL